MNANRLCSLSLLLLLLFGFQGHACADTAEDLARECARDNSSDSYCFGYIVGFYDGRTTRDYGRAELKSCPPTDESRQNLAVSKRQMVLVFQKWATDHPEKLYEDDWSALRSAFANAWPCASKQ
ncbi:Rap1a/Tai family immunity protein [Burkholderia sp. BDU5]|uniref:Rap1a/Tai family immunity protein n=1 Tax=Burkholderia sp. BDU5 TaxID=1385590 RepID=UPI003FA4A3CC